MDILLDEQDYYRVSLQSVIAHYDYETMVVFYQPIIGCHATMLYFTLLSESKKEEWVEVSTHKVLMKQMNLSLMEILDSRRKLEGIGLLKTYRKENGPGEAHSYIYELYAPRTPKEFLKDPLFRRLFEMSVSTKEFKRLLRIYSVKKVPEEHFEITAKYGDVFDDTIYAKIPKDERILSRISGDISDGFDEKKFLKAVKENYGMKSKLFSDDVLFEIRRIALLFGLNEMYMVDLILKCYEQNEVNTLDTEALFLLARNSIIYPTQKKNYENDANIYESDSKFAAKINQMNITAPYEYLRLLSDQENPSPSDISILNDLSAKYKLPIGVINAIVSYTLEHNNMALPRAYCEKIGAQMSRLKVTNAMETINALSTRFKKSKNKVASDSKTEDESYELPPQEDVSLEELRKNMEKLR